MKYAAFVITFKRPSILKETVQGLFRQTMPPSKVLIVDNDVEGSSKRVIDDLNDTRISVYQVGLNSGPAGAAYHGISILQDEGWEWILWVDDDDPPPFTNSIEKLIDIIMHVPTENVGIVGAVGVKFNKRTAKAARFRDHELKGLLEVDQVAGNMLPMVHRNLLMNEILPDQQLFFGFEELDFGLSLKRAGFKIIVSGEEMLRYREKAGRIGVKKKSFQSKNVSTLWREYYSTRNLINILLRKEKAYKGIVLLTCRTIVKAFAGFIFGYNYGAKNMYYLLSGLKDGFLNKMGTVVLPVPKQQLDYMKELPPPQ